MTLKADDKKRERTTHYIMSFVGGCFAIYALAEHSNVFASAETANMITLVKSIFDGNVFETGIRLGNVFIYAFGIICSLWLSKYHTKYQKWASLLISAIAAAVSAFMPDGLPHVVALYPIAFAMAFQFSAFRSADGLASATTFLTGNFRQLITHLFLCVTENDTNIRKKERSAFLLYAGVMLLFFAGISFTYIADKYMNEKSILLVLVPLTAAALYELSGISVRRAEVAVTSAESDDI